MMVVMVMEKRGRAREGVRRATGHSHQRKRHRYKENLYLPSRGRQHRRPHTWGPRPLGALHLNSRHRRGRGTSPPVARRHQARAISHSTHKDPACNATSTRVTLSDTHTREGAGISGTSRSGGRLSNSPGAPSSLPANRMGGCLTQARALCIPARPQSPFRSPPNGQSELHKRSHSRLRHSHPEGHNGHTVAHARQPRRSVLQTYSPFTGQALVSMAPCLRCAAHAHAHKGREQSHAIFRSRHHHPGRGRKSGPLSQWTSLLDNIKYEHTHTHTHTQLGSTGGEMTGH
ncbi:hypothetical protein H696_01198 [Fonticula alba]|uniref:Uncharacterized protein n=1 Tax=Fonticula alba TaxID=691883 RepID=A0A058ZBI1_FONAL|nr:hypothetical protein H696_01198 [Fonticula alba]KCV71780.1 hypothetical protein H696_01198 [Fonticula alba]|eukprot:XP_009493358.1 hypothetical protein H696_01198 [Fonticula alba]